MYIAGIGLNQQMLPVFWYILLAATGAWFFLSYRLYAELLRHHPRLYASLGSPELFKRRSFITNFRVLRFIFAQNPETTVTPAVARLCQGLRSLFYIYVICLAGCATLIFTRTL